MLECPTLLDYLLDEETPLRDLLDLIIAIDLITSHPEGIEQRDMPGAKIVATTARMLAEDIRQTWREAVERASKSVGAGK